MDSIIREVCPKGCLHTFHEKCLKMWLKNHTTCPLCRMDCGGCYVPKEKAFNKISYVIAKQTLYFDNIEAAHAQLKMLKKIAIIFQILNTKLEFPFSKNRKLQFNAKACLRIWRRYCPNKKIPSRRDAEDLAYAIAHRYSRDFYHDPNISVSIIEKRQMARRDIQIFNRIVRKVVEQKKLAAQNNV